jgi:hypothetical protein
MATRGGNACLIFLKIEIEMSEGVIFDIAAGVPEIVELGELVSNLASPCNEIHLHELQCVL